MRFRRFQRIWLSPRLWKRHVIFWSGGLAVGFVAVLFAHAADAAQLLFRRVLDVSPFVSLALTPAGLAIAAALTRRFFPGSQGSGIPQAIAARHHAEPMARLRLLSMRIAVGKVALTLLALATGAPAGREGPTVQVGASVMSSVGRIAGGRYQGLILAGSAAGLAAAFNTPLAGIVFAIEEMSRSFEQRTSGLVLAAVIVAGIASLALAGDYTYFGHTSASLASPADWAAVPLCGLLGGLMGGLFARSVVAVARGLPGRAGSLIRQHPILFAALCGLLVAVIGIVSGGTTYGTGYHEAKELLQGAGQIPASFGLLKMLATILCSVSGIPGGIFSPSLAVGAGFGANVAALLPHAPLGAVVLLGMAAYFAGVVQAPITAFVIVLEMTDNHAMAIPVMAAALIGYGTSRLSGAEPIYHALAEGFMPETGEGARPQASGHSP